MRIGQVIGKVVLSRVHPSLVGAQFKIVLPITFNDLVEPDPVEEARKVCEQEKNLKPDECVAAAINRLVNSDIPRKWGSEVVVYDDCCVAVDEWVAFSEGAEAAASFGGGSCPVDAFAGAILDTVVIDAPTVDALVALKETKRD